MTTNPSLDGRAAGRDPAGSALSARRDRDGGELEWFVAAILIVAAFFLIGYNERLPNGAEPAQAGSGFDVPSEGISTRPGSPPG